MIDFPFYKFLKNNLNTKKLKLKLKHKKKIFERRKEPPSLLLEVQYSTTEPDNKSNVCTDNALHI